MNFQIIFLLLPQHLSYLRSHFLQSRKFLKLSFSFYVLFREDFGLSGCKQVLQPHIPMIFIFPCTSIIVYQFRHFVSRIHHLTITSNSCALRRHREPLLRIIPKAPCLFSLQDMCLHHSCNRELNPSLDQFLKHVLSRLRQGRSLLVLLDGILVNSFVLP